MSNVRCPRDRSARKSISVARLGERAVMPHRDQILATRIDVLRSRNGELILALGGGLLQPQQPQGAAAASVVLNTMQATLLLDAHRSVAWMDQHMIEDPCLISTATPVRMRFLGWWSIDQPVGAVCLVIAPDLVEPLAGIAISSQAGSSIVVY